VITGYVGMIGHGKTMLAVREVAMLAKVRRGVLVASNIKLTIPGVEAIQLPVSENGLDGVPELLKLARSDRRGVVLLIDEIGILLPARFWQAQDSIELMWACSQSRKMAADIIFTAQHPNQVDVAVRRLTESVTKVRAIPGPSIGRRESGKRPWVIRTTRWLPADVDLKRDERRLSAGWVVYPRKVEAWYDTDELVMPAQSLKRALSRRRASPADITERPSPWAPPVTEGRSAA
jgi:hypothetical protein